MPPVIQARNPLRTYQFRVAVQNVDIQGLAGAPAAYVAGVKSVSGLRFSIGAWEVWEAGNNLHRYANPNKVVWEPVTLEQGLALDDTFEKWADAVIAYAQSGTYIAAQPIKRQVVIDVWDENKYPGGPPTPAKPPAPPPGSMQQVPPIDASSFQGDRFRRYRLKNAWISKYQSLAKLDSMASEIALLSVELTHEGWQMEPITQSA